MKSTATLTVSEAELKLRTDYYLQKVELEGLTLLIDRDGVIAAQITPPSAQPDLTVARAQG